MEMLGPPPVPRGAAIWVPLSGDPPSSDAMDFLPDKHLMEVETCMISRAMLVFDKWTCNTNGRQTLFFQGTPQRNLKQGSCDTAQS